MGRAGLNRKTALATAMLTLTAEAPDLDVLGRFGGPVFGFAHHRGFTHSFLGIPLISAFVLGVLYLIWQARQREANKFGLRPRWALLFWYGCLAGLSHILLDFTNNYGVRPFWPFSERWYSWDIVFILEPVMLILLIGGLVVPSFFGLINQEIGVRQRGPKGRVGATLALIGIVALWALRDFEHRRAVAALEARTYRGAEAIRVSAYPYFIDPFHWSGVIETESFIAIAPVDSLTPEVDPNDRMEVHYKPEQTPVMLAAKRSYLGRVYLDWAKYPITETETLQPPQEGYIVRFRDLRYVYPRAAPSRILSASWFSFFFSRRGTLGAGVEMDPNLRVVAAFFGLRRETAPVREKQ